ncbi:MAG TPA: hypothetical protein VML75_25400 [Kofleriaceae bacterium]|nr:hypothetical protein [Kofleriaceae bacterium]
MSTIKTESDEPNLDRARRRLLKYAVYVPPVVIGALSLAQSGCQPASCGPANCGPSGTPCGPGNCPPEN